MNTLVHYQNDLINVVYFCTFKYKKIIYFFFRNIMNITTNTNTHKDDDEKCILRGHWVYLHIRGKWGNLSVSNKRQYTEELHYIAENFPCSICRPHFKQYLLDNPPEGAIDINAYMWKFHNDVNIRLGKPTITFEQYAEMYLTEKGYNCASCENEHNKQRYNISKGFNNIDIKPIKKIPNIFSVNN